jgi:PPOX class probable F420-dependent enzyme
VRVRVARSRPCSGAYDVVVSEPTPSRRLRGGAILEDPLVRELLALRLVAVLTTLEPDGSVHAVPIWISAEHGEIVLATGSASRKVRNLERDPRATIVLHDSRPGCDIAGVTLRGRIEIVRGAAAAPLIERVHLRYVTAAGLGRSEVRAFLGSDDVALRFLPESATTWDERASAAARVLRESGEALPLEPTTPR